MKILAAIDGHEQRADALALGADLARIGEGRLLVVYVYPWSRASARLGPAYAVTVREDAEELLESATRELAGVPVDTRAVGDLSVAHALHRMAQEEDADVIVIGSTHHGPVGRVLTGGTGERVVHAAPCPVAIAPRGYEPAGVEPRRIGVAYDASPQAREALAWAGGFAAGVGAAVTVLDVYESAMASVAYPGVVIPFDEIDPAMRKDCQAELDEAVASLPAEVRPFGRMLEGRVPDALAEAAKDLDLLVAGSRGYGPHGAVLLGGVTHELARMSPCPLILLPLGAGHAEDAAAGVAVAAPGT